MSATYNRKRSYSELKITGPPLYNQGEISSEDDCSVPAGVPLDSQRTALLIVDVQPEYWSECPAVRKDFPHFPERISRLVQQCRESKTKCIWVRADYSYDKSPWLQQFTRLHKGRIPPIVKPNSKWEAFAQPAPGEFIMTKSSWSSTTDTGLINMLKESGIETVLVCGLITSVCVQHSAFGIFEAGFRTCLVTDACADRGKSRHDAALALYGGYMYELHTVKSVEEQLDSAPAMKTSKIFHNSTVKNSPSSASLCTLGTSNLSDVSESDVEEPSGRESPEQFAVSSF